MADKSYGKRICANDEWRPPKRCWSGRRFCPLLFRLDPVKPGFAGSRSFRGSALNGHQVDRGELSSSVDLEIKLEAIPFVDALQARTLNRADMHESVFLAV